MVSVPISCITRRDLLIGSCDRLGLGRNDRMRRPSRRTEVMLVVFFCLFYIALYVSAPTESSPVLSAPFSRTIRFACRLHPFAWLQDPLGGKPALCSISNVYMRGIWQTREQGCFQMLCYCPVTTKASPFAISVRA